MNQTTIKDIKSYKNAYFLGIGGIGMSAIARYLMRLGIHVYGYDKTETQLTQALASEGAEIYYNDSSSLIPTQLLNEDETLWVLTPAIPTEHEGWAYLKSLNTPIFKRSEVLGSIARNGFCIAVAGTHGKTTTSTLIAHLLMECNIRFAAFLGGISANYNTNYLHNENGKFLFGDNNPLEVIVLEADEFDRSFHRLNPDLAVVTAIDPDHLDIYGDETTFRKAFAEFIQLIRKNDIPAGYSIQSNAVVLQKELDVPVPAGVEKASYGTDKENGDVEQSNLPKFSGNNIQIIDGTYQFDFVINQEKKGQFQCGLPGFHNVENAVAALAICAHYLGLPLDQLQQGIASFKGAKRRFEYVVKSPNYIVIDDYAHHPQELNAIIGSVKSLYPNHTLTGIFQPHLFTRTRDFADGFSESLSALDTLWLMDIYPAREKPIPGITSAWLLESIKTEATVLSPEAILKNIETEAPSLLLILGAGDIDKLVNPIKEIYLKKL